MKWLLIILINTGQGDIIAKAGPIDSQERCEAALVALALVSTPNYRFACLPVGISA